MKYKKTGIDWMPEVPKHWEIRRLKQFSKIETGTTPPKVENSNYSKKGIPWIKPDNLNEFEPLFDSSERISNDGLKGARLIPKGSVLVCCIGTIGKIGIAGVDLTTNQQINSIIFNQDVVSQSFGKFLLFASEKEHWRISTKSVVSILNKTAQGCIKYPIPPIDEQNVIADYLDIQTEKIKKIIQSKQCFIELLKEQRQSIITNAVTKGIDGNAKLKTTVLGEIPEHWEVRRLKYIANVAFSTVDKHSYKGEKEVKLCNYVDVYKNEYITNDFDFMKATASDAEIKRFNVQKGDVIITKDSETADDIAIPALFIEDMENVVCGYHLAHIKPNRDLIESEFLFRLFQSKKINSHFEVAAKGVTRHGLAYDDINSVYVPYPSTLDEQRLIIKYIKTETSTLDIAINKAVREIELIKEYREAMIAEAVTGKMKIK